METQEESETHMAVDQSSHCNVRDLTEEEKLKLEKDTKVVSEFKQNKLEKEALKNWDLFYKRNSTKFFKDRHWTTREFQDLCGDKRDGNSVVVMEMGCGVGNFMFPLMQEDSSLYFYACDFSPRAVQFVKENPAFDADRCTPFQCDLTADPLTDNVPAEAVDIATLIFVLSAIHPDKMVAALKNIYQVLKPGGCVLLRDYGLFDHAMLRFAPGHKLSENFYVRQDGTRAYYFSLDVLAEKFISAGFTPDMNDYIFRKTVNKKEGLSAPRVFVQAKFVKPSQSAENTAEKIDCTAGSGPAVDSCDTAAVEQSCMIPECEAVSIRGTANKDTDMELATLLNGSVLSDTDIQADASILPSYTSTDTIS